MNKELIQQALDALVYHTQQTRPIGRTKYAIAALEVVLAQPSQINCSGAIVVVPVRTFPEANTKLSDVFVNPDGVKFGTNCWMSHETIIGKTPDELDHVSILINSGYMQWVKASIEKQFADDYAKAHIEATPTSAAIAPPVQPDLTALIAKVHKARGRYNSQNAMCDLFDACGLESFRPGKELVHSRRPA